jgi:hypothetical protein
MLGGLICVTPVAWLDGVSVVSAMIPPGNCMECRKMRNTVGAQILGRLVIPVVLSCAAVQPRTASAIPALPAESIGPAQGPGAHRIDGNYIQRGGVLLIEIAGPSAFDRLDVNGIAVLDKVLIRFAFTGGYGPSAGARFDFLKARAVNVRAPRVEIVGLQEGFLYGVSDVNGILSLNARSDGTAQPGRYTLLLSSLSLQLVVMFRAMQG